MSLDADHIVDRRRMRRKLTFWRVFAVLLAICAVVGVGAALRAPGTSVLTGGDRRLRSRASPSPASSAPTRSGWRRWSGSASSRAKAVIVHINSPGGTTSGSEELHDSLIAAEGAEADGGRGRRARRLRRLHRRASPPTTSWRRRPRWSARSACCSSIPTSSELLKTLGVKMEEIKSSPLKAAPNGFEPTSPEARAAIEAIVEDSYAWFRNLVKTRRNLDDATLERVADGRVFTGRQGVALKLVDELGDERTAIAWLAKEKNIDPKTPVRDYPLRDRLSDLPFLHTAAVATARCARAWLAGAAPRGMGRRAGDRATQS